MWPRVNQGDVDEAEEAFRIRVGTDGDTIGIFQFCKHRLTRLETCELIGSY